MGKEGLCARTIHIFPSSEPSTIRRAMLGFYSSKKLQVQTGVVSCEHALSLSIMFPRAERIDSECQEMRCSYYHLR